MIARRSLAAAGALGAVVVTAGGVVAISGDGTGDTAAAASQAAATTEITRQDLVERDSVDGTLGYSDSRPVVNRLSGTVTWTPAVGATVRTNHRLYEVDGAAVYLLHGSFPAYRTLQAGLEGDDVRQLERNLRSLDLDPDGEMDVDGRWDAGTTSAVQRWQRRKGLEADGVIALGRVVFAPGSRRVADVAIATGGSAGASGTSTAAGPGQDDAAAGTSGTLMTTTSTKRIVTVDLDTSDVELAKEGAEVEVELPGDERVEGTIARVGRVAKQAAGQDPADDDAPVTVKVIVKLREPRSGGLDQAPVDVLLEQRRAERVLTVPVTALLARRGGTFAVEVRRGSDRRIVPVETGLFTSGLVEIEGAGLEPGMRVTEAEV